MRPLIPILTAVFVTALSIPFTSAATLVAYDFGTDPSTLQLSHSTLHAGLTATEISKGNVDFFNSGAQLDTSSPRALGLLRTSGPLATSEATASANLRHISFTLTPQAGQSLVITSLSFRAF